MIPPGGKITNTQGSIDLIGLLGKFMFSSSSSSSSAPAPGPAPAPAATQPAPETHP
jgi:hypothetical protein